MKIMRKMSTRKKTRSKGQKEMRAEYRFDYSKARLNRFAPLMKGGTVAIVLDKDVASVFRSTESVNNFLRSVISALPKELKPQSKSG